MESMARRSTGTPPRDPNGTAAAEDGRPKKPTKRVYTREYKQRVLGEVDALLESGELGCVGAYLRREGLHSSHLHRWREERQAGGLAGPEKKRGRPPTRDATKEENLRLQREVAKLQAKLRKAEIVIDVQKKLSALLGMEFPSEPDDENS